MRTDIKDVQFCPHSQHIVPRAEMTRILSDDGKVWRRICKSCKESTFERRKVKSADR